jgi:hypothetical protein
MLKVGMKVRMSVLGKAKYSNTNSNPHTLRGKVYASDGYRIGVRWSNGHKNTYRAEDLAYSSLKGVAKFLRRIDGKEVEEPTPVNTLEAEPGMVEVILEW